MELGHLPYREGTYEDYVGRPAWNGSARRSGGGKWPTWWRA